ncbi:LacI family transcriptional regulator [Arthrobacter sp. MYb227]|uniref:LacI family DNA-binding transcriptional regulator n=1 Tax=Arthrobacter sp. MYb227 TaxID=1848601 RepID=UPI000CFD7563|nr:LacI family DNA-binding transcriptional regulator [Arthrobacter sp. MYb227]PQZ88121.1 LacI family transcriptional regulator [Arthrobacter sp. MYb227]
MTLSHSSFPDLGDGTATSHHARTTRGPSMADVAREAGVSSQTVSRVANGLSNVEESTKKRVLDAMAKLGYRPNRAARALKSGRFKSIGVIMFTLSTFGNMRTLDAIATAASRAGYSVTLIPLTDPTTGKVSGAYHQLREQQVDGVVIIFEAHLLDHTDIELPEDLPAVIIDSNTGSGYSVVDTDQQQGARLATQHLLDLGHHQVWHIGGPASSFSALHRAESWKQTLEQAGITPPVVTHGDWSAESGYQIGIQLGKNTQVSAIFAANDQMALGAMRAMHELGRSIPEDVSIVGFDDLEESASFWPPLTTIRQDFNTVGRLSIENLLKQIAGNTSVRDVSVPTELMVRKSTAAPRPPKNAAECKE